MPPEELRAAFDTALAGRLLLDHPFYRRWQAGTLGPGELAAYAAQYRHFEEALPGFLRGLGVRLQPGPAADLVQRNLRDEESNPEPHTALFTRFADAVSAVETPPTAATAALLAAYRGLIASSAGEGLAAVVAYEAQAPGIAASKAEGLRHHYGVSNSGTEFWEVHATMDVEHAAWAMDALATLPITTSAVVSAVRRTADAWWAFLDDRERAAPLIAA